MSKKIDFAVLAALNDSAADVGRSTGLQHTFIVHMSKADGSDDTKQTLNVVALNWADAWMLAGTAINAFMNHQHGRTVHSISAAR